MSMSQTLSSRNSFTRRSCSVRLARLHATLGLAGVRTDDLDVQLGQRAAELRHAGAALRVTVDPEDRVLVRVEGYRAAVGGQISLETLRSTSPYSRSERSAVASSCSWHRR